MQPQNIFWETNCAVTMLLELCRFSEKNKVETLQDWKLPEKEVLSVCEELGIGFVPYGPLCRGYLSGTLNEQTKFYATNDNRAGLPRFTRKP